VRDITGRKQAQAAIARLAEIGEPSAMIVHEVRSPLTTVLMGLEPSTATVGTEASEVGAGRSRSPENAAE